MRERTKLDEAISTYLRLEAELNDNLELIEMGEAEDDAAVVEEAETALKVAHEEAARQRAVTLLSGEADSNDAYVEIHSGAGGTESQDWASMLLRMYTRWAESKGHKVELIERHDG